MRRENVRAEMTGVSQSVSVVASASSPTVPLSVNLVPQLADLSDIRNCFVTGQSRLVTENSEPIDAMYMLLLPRFRGALMKNALKMGRGFEVGGYGTRKPTAVTSFGGATILTLPIFWDPVKAEFAGEPLWSDAFIEAMVAGLVSEDDNPLVTWTDYLVAMFLFPPSELLLEKLSEMPGVLVPIQVTAWHILFALAMRPLAYSLAGKLNWPLSEVLAWIARGIPTTVKVALVTMLHASGVSLGVLNAHGLLRYLV